MLRRSFQVARVAALGVLVVLVMADVASAQFVANLLKNAGVGANVGVVKPVDNDVDVGPTLGVSFGFAPKPGWGWAGTLGWFSGDLVIVDGSDQRDIGQIRIRPLLGGIGYTWVSGKLASTVSLTAGISFNSADIDDGYEQSFGPGTDVSLQMDNSFAVRPAIEVEYALTPKFALTAYSNFFITTINSELRTPVGRFANEWNATSFQTGVGVMVYPFR